MWACGLDWAGPGQRQVADACECDNEPSGSVKCGEFLDQLQTSQLLKKDSAPWSKEVYMVTCGVSCYGVLGMKAVKRCPSQQTQTFYATKLPKLSIIGD